MCLILILGLGAISSQICQCAGCSDKNPAKAATQKLASPALMSPSVKVILVCNTEAMEIFLHIPSGLVNTGWHTEN